LRLIVGDLTGGGEARSPLHALVSSPLEAPPAFFVYPALHLHWTGSNWRSPRSHTSVLGSISSLSLFFCFFGEKKPKIYPDGSPQGPTDA
jgi:hypothetical protein